MFEGIGIALVDLSSITLNICVNMSSEIVANLYFNEIYHKLFDEHISIANIITNHSC